MITSKYKDEERQKDNKLRRGKEEAHVEWPEVSRPPDNVDFFPGKALNENTVPLGVVTLCYLRHFSIIFANGFSHVYILITRIAEMISFIVRILSSVRLAVSSRSLENTLPIQPAIKRDKLCYK